MRALGSCCGYSTTEVWAHLKRLAPPPRLNGRVALSKGSVTWQTGAMLVTKHPTLNTSAVPRSSAGCTITTNILNNFRIIVSSTLLAPFDLDAWPRLRSVEVSSLTRYTSPFSYSQHPTTCYGPCNGLSGPLCNLVAPRVTFDQLHSTQITLLGDALVSCHR